MQKVVETFGEELVRLTKAAERELRVLSKKREELLDVWAGMLKDIPNPNFAGTKLEIQPATVKDHARISLLFVGQRSVEAVVAALEKSMEVTFRKDPSLFNYSVKWKGIVVIVHAGA